MNLREGVRRLSFIAGFAIAAATALHFSASAPTASATEDFWVMSIKSELEAQWGKRLDWSAETAGIAFIQKWCATPGTMTIAETCKQAKNDISGLSRRQVEHWLLVAATSLGMLLASWLLWRLLDWVLAGFQQQHNARPQQ